VIDPRSVGLSICRKSISRTVDLHLNLKHIAIDASEAFELRD
jgi:hypothetical protein